MKKLAFLLTIGMAILFTSCKKDRIENPDTTPDTMEELQVPADFSWKTTKDYSLTLSANANGIAEVNNTSGISYQKAYLSTGQAYTMKLTVPAYEKNVIIKFNGEQKTIELTSLTITVQF
ncbi:MAG: hypothetical protein FD155_2076 [Bacteroidetes bacterium]|nr:MAG: hypothetical protein FD155_2076 [Bacteroidota bacterium]